MKFRIKAHSSRPGVQVVEMWLDDVLIGTLTPGDDPRTLRVISKHFGRILNGDLKTSCVSVADPMMVEVTIPVLL